MTVMWSLSTPNRCQEAVIATLPKVLINQADIKSAGGAAPRVRTHTIAGRRSEEGLRLQDTGPGMAMELTASAGTTPAREQSLITRPQPWMLAFKRSFALIWIRGVPKTMAA